MIPRSSRILALSLALTFIGCSDDDDQRAVGASCITNLDCVSDICHMDICASRSPLKQGKPCTGNGQCRSFRCAGGVCQKGTRETGLKCHYDDECASGFCVQDRCKLRPDGGVDAGPDMQPDQAVPDQAVPDVAVPDQPAPKPDVLHDLPAPDLPVADKSGPD